MADFIKNPVVTLPAVKLEQQVPDEELFFTEAEKAQIAEYISRYPTADGATMRALWLAQEKFSFLPPEVIRLVSTELGLSYAKVYGVATFYTQYFKEKRGTYVFDVCTCFACQVCGGFDMLHYLEEKLGVHKGETTDDGLFTVQEAECLGACGSAPMLQITNGVYVHNLTEEKIDALIDGLREGNEPAFSSVTLPQDEAELGGNRRTDIEAAERYTTPPVARTVG
ncbi:MAG: NAD(P)H-dependent oxidoreductase subunit E [Bacteroidota bacterium]